MAGDDAGGGALGPRRKAVGCSPVGGAKEFHVAQRFDPDLKKQFDATINWERNSEPYLRIESAQTDRLGASKGGMVRSV